MSESQFLVTRSALRVDAERLAGIPPQSGGTSFKVERAS